MMLQMTAFLRENDWSIPVELRCEIQVNTWWTHSKAMNQLYTKRNFEVPMRSTAAYLAANLKPFFDQTASSWSDLAKV